MYFEYLRNPIESLHERSCKPFVTIGRRVRSFGAALAGGSPLSSPTPSSIVELSPLGRPAMEFRDGLLTDFPLQNPLAKATLFLPHPQGRRVVSARSLCRWAPL